MEKPGSEIDVVFVKPRFEDISKSQGTHLPHWTTGGGTYHVVFRLIDSLPKLVVEEFRAERDRLLLKEKLSPQALERLTRLHSERIERHLDSSSGECLMLDSSIAQIVADAVCHFHRSRYFLYSWAVMPSHVHLIIQPINEYELDAILESIKSFTARSINRQLNRSGRVWQAESFDHLIRTYDSLEASIAYVLANPIAAGLTDWKWVGCHSDPPEE